MLGGGSVALPRSVKKVKLGGLRTSSQVRYVGGIPMPVGREARLLQESRAPSTSASTAESSLNSSMASMNTTAASSSSMRLSESGGSSRSSTHRSHTPAYSTKHDPHRLRCNLHRAGSSTKSRRGSPNRRAKPHFKHHHMGEATTNRHGRDEGTHDARIKATIEEAQLHSTVILGKSVIKKGVLYEFHQSTGFDTQQLSHLMKAFKGHVAGNVDADGAATSVNQAQFEELIMQLFPDIDHALIVRVFQTFDEDDSGSICFRELVHGCGKLANGQEQGPEQRLELLFSLYDTDGSGEMSIAELIKIVGNKNVELGDSVGLITNLMKTVDNDGSGTMSFKEFMSATSSIPMLSDVFLQLLPTSSQLSKTVKHAASKTEFDWNRLLELEHFFHLRIGVGEELDRATFRQLLHEFLGFDDAFMVEQMYEHMDADGSGKLDFKELLLGFSTMLSGSVDDKIAFYFSLYDQDGSGTIEHTELLRLLTRCDEHRSTNLTPERVHALLEEAGLKSLDEDGDGCISLEELRAAASKSEEVMHFLGAVL